MLVECRLEPTGRMRQPASTWAPASAFAPTRSRIVPDRAHPALPGRASFHGPRTTCSLQHHDRIAAGMNRFARWGLGSPRCGGRSCQPSRAPRQESQPSIGDDLAIDVQSQLGHEPEGKLPIVSAMTPWALGPAPTKLSAPAERQPSPRSPDWFGTITVPTRTCDSLAASSRHTAAS